VGGQLYPSRESSPYLVGGFSPTQSEKYARQIGNLPTNIGENEN